jgi:hypothetical protein
MAHVGPQHHKKNIVKNVTYTSKQFRIEDILLHISTEKIWSMGTNLHN